MENKSSDECEEAIRKLAEITKCDEAFAHCILQDVDYNLDHALAKFYANQEESQAIELSDGSENNYEEDNNNEALEDNSPEAVQPKSEILPPELVFLSWNIDGLDTVNLNKRFTGVLHIIAKTNPEVIFLQEVVGDIMPKLMEVLSGMYHIFISDPLFPYFCVTLVSRNIRVINDVSIPFHNTAMGRGMIVVEAEWKKLKLKLINTHLESMSEYSAQRRMQFTECLRKLEEMRAKSNISETLAIFAGDLNIRDHEVPTLPANIRDAWIEDGIKSDRKFTWDMSRNDNKQAGGARLRFDRVYYSGPYSRVDFSLAGTQRIRGIHCFPSDHFAVVCRWHGVAQQAS